MATCPPFERSPASRSAPAARGGGEWATVPCASARDTSSPAKRMNAKMVRGRQGCGLAVHGDAPSDDHGEAPTHGDAPPAPLDGQRSSVAAPLSLLCDAASLPAVDVLDSSGALLVAGAGSPPNSADAPPPPRGRFVTPTPEPEAARLPVLAPSAACSPPPPASPLGGGRPASRGAALGFGGGRPPYMVGRAAPAAGARQLPNLSWSPQQVLRQPQAAPRLASPCLPPCPSWITALKSQLKVELSY